MSGTDLATASVKVPQVATATAPTPSLAGQITVYSDALVPDALSVKDSTGLTAAIAKVLKRVNAITNFGAVSTELVGISFTGIPANDLAVGRILRVRLWGVSTNIATATTLTLRCRIGTGAVNAVGGAASSNAIVASVALATAAAAKTTVPFVYTCDVAVYTSGASGTCLGQCGHSGGPAEAIAQTGTGLTAAVALNTTVANNLDFTLQPGSATDITQTSIHGGTLEIL
jgi:hypothetical protein